MRRNKLGSQGKRKAKYEEGLALAISVLTGLLLLAGTSALMAKQIMARRTAAGESYKHIAEIAATNGFNRLVRLINSDGSHRDVSYLWGLDQSKGEWDLPEYQLRSKLIEPCTDLLHRTDSSIQQRLKGADLTQGQPLGDTGSGKEITMSFRLAKQENKGANEASLTVEGFAKRAGINLLNRSRVQRNLELREFVAEENDFGVLAAKNLELGSSNIDGAGSILWLIDPNSNRFNRSSLCTPSSLASAARAYSWGTRGRIWPIKKPFPPSSLFDTPVVNTDHRHSWWFGSYAYQSPCNSNACVHDGRYWRDAAQYYGGLVHIERTSYSRYSPARTISLHGEKICNGNRTKPCLIKVSGINLQSGTILAIETTSSAGARPVVIRADGNTTLDTSGGQLCQGQYSSSHYGRLNCDPSAKPEQLVLVANKGDNSSNCYGGARQVLQISGNSLPSAMVLMPSGTVQINQRANIKGMIWAGNLCARSGLRLNTGTANNSVIAGFRKTWDPGENQAFGRLLNRAVRGTGLDSFQQW
jgi:hypothetical protein